MKKAQATNAFLEGALLLVAEYRSTRAETIRWRDRETQKALEAPVCNHAIEIGGLQIKLSERLPPDTDPAKIVSPFKKGEMVLVHLEQLIRAKGVYSAQGTLEKLEA